MFFSILTASTPFGISSPTYFRLSYADISINPYNKERLQPDVSSQSSLSFRASQSAGTGHPDGNSCSATLCSAVHTDVAHLADPGSLSWRPIANLWREISALFGGEDNARRFLNQPRPELAGETPLHFLNTGEPGIVHNLVVAIREMLP